MSVLAGNLRESAPWRVAVRAGEDTARPARFRSEMLNLISHYGLGWFGCYHCHGSVVIALRQQSSGSRAAWVRLTVETGLRIFFCRFFVFVFPTHNLHAVVNVSLSVSHLLVHAACHCMGQGNGGK